MVFEMDRRGVRVTSGGTKVSQIANIFQNNLIRTDHLETGKITGGITTKKDSEASSVSVNNTTSTTVTTTVTTNVTTENSVVKPDSHSNRFNSARALFEKLGTTTGEDTAKTPSAPAVSGNFSVNRVGLGKMGRSTESIGEPASTSSSSTVISKTISGSSSLSSALNKSNGSSSSMHSDTKLQRSESQETPGLDKENTTLPNRLIRQGSDSRVTQDTGEAVRTNGVNCLKPNVESSPPAANGDAAKPRIVGSTVLRPTPRQFDVGKKPAVAEKPPVVAKPTSLVDSKTKLNGRELIEKQKNWISHFSSPPPKKPGSPEKTQKGFAVQPKPLEIDATGTSPKSSPLSSPSKSITSPTSATSSSISKIREKSTSLDREFPSSRSNSTNNKSSTEETTSSNEPPVNVSVSSTKSEPSLPSSTNRLENKFIETVSSTSSVSSEKESEIAVSYASVQLSRDRHRLLEQDTKQGKSINNDSTTTQKRNSGDSSDSASGESFLDRLQNLKGTTTKVSKQEEQQQESEHSVTTTSSTKIVVETVKTQKHSEDQYHHHSESIIGSVVDSNRIAPPGYDDQASSTSESISDPTSVSSSQVTIIEKSVSGNRANTSSPSSSDTSKDQRELDQHASPVDNEETCVDDSLSVISNISSNVDPHASMEEYRESEEIEVIKETTEKSDISRDYENWLKGQTSSVPESIPSKQVRHTGLSCPSLMHKIILSHTFTYVRVKGKCLRIYVSILFYK